MTGANGVILHRAELMLAQLQELAIRDRILKQQVPNPQEPVFILLRSLAVENKQRLILQQLLSILEVLGDKPEAKNIAETTGKLAAKTLSNLLAEARETPPWQERLNQEVFSLLQPTEASPPVSEIPAAQVSLSALEVISELLQELDPLVQAAALFALAQLAPQQGRQQAQKMLSSTKPGDWLVQETAANILGEPRLGTLDKLLLLFKIELFKSVKPEALIDLALDAQIRDYPQNAVLCKVGEPSDELFLLIKGEADATVVKDEREIVVNTIKAGQTVGEMGVLTRQQRSANVIAKGEKNQVLVIKAENFDARLRNNSEVARGLLLDMVDRLQRLTAQIKN